MSMVSKSRQTAESGQRRRRRRTTVSQQDYSCYNLYLVYLAVPDIFLNIFILALYGRYVDQKWNPSFGGYIVDSVLWETRKPLNSSFILACSEANTYLDAIIAFEVYTLLNISHNAIRHTPPGLLNVSMKAVAVYAIACIVFVLRWFLEDTQCPPMLQAAIYFVISTGIPMVYLFYVSAVIYRRGLIASTTGKLKLISLYFLRIISIFIFLWLPGMILLALSRKPHDRINISDYSPRYSSVALIFCSLQPILSTCMEMTEPDVRKSVFILLTRLVGVSGQRKIMIMMLTSNNQIQKKMESTDNFKRDGKSNVAIIFNTVIITLIIFSSLMSNCFYSIDQS